LFGVLSRERVVWFQSRAVLGGVEGNVLQTLFCFHLLKIMFIPGLLANGKDPKFNRGD
jgi:hypothetical protein